MSSRAGRVDTAPATMRLAMLAIASAAMLQSWETEPGQESGLWFHQPRPETELHEPPAAPAPTPDPNELSRKTRLALFEAIADLNTRAFLDLLNAGADPDGELPQPPPREFLKKFSDRRLRYYLAAEPGFTPLMLAASMGNLVYVRMLLAAGASPNKLTRRHRTFALWLAGNYGHVEIMQEMLRVGPGSEARKLRIEISVGEQRLRLFRHHQLIFESPVSTGKKSHPTPTGDFVVTDKHRHWRSTLYEAEMPWFLRLSASDFGLHAGRLPGYPASHGCIRLPPEKTKELYSMVPAGTLVQIR